jgi:hypothetical protein
VVHSVHFLGALGVLGGSFFSMPLALNLEVGVRVPTFSLPVAHDATGFSGMTLSKNRAADFTTGFSSSFTTP